MIDPATAVGIATAAYEIADTLGTLASSAFGNSAITVEVFNLTTDVTLTLEYQSKRDDAGVNGKFAGDISGSKGPPPHQVPAAQNGEKGKAAVFQSVRCDNDPRGNRNFVIYKAEKPGFQPIYLCIAWSAPTLGSDTFYFVRWLREWDEEKHKNHVLAGIGYIKKDGKWELTLGGSRDWFMETAKEFVGKQDGNNNDIRGVQRDTQRLISTKDAAATESSAALRVIGTFGFAPLKIFVQDAWVKSGERDYEDKAMLITHVDPKLPLTKVIDNGPPKF